MHASVRSRALAAICAAFLVPDAGLAQDRLGSNATSKLMAEVPNGMEEPFGQAIRAWARFAEADAKLAEALAAERKRITMQLSGSSEQAKVEARTARQPGLTQALGRDALNRHLYPWAYGGGSQDPAPSADDSVAAAVEANAKASLSPELAREFAFVLGQWKEFRNRACTLVALYRTSKPGLDPACVADFSTSLAGAGKVIGSLIREEARLRRDLPKIAATGAKLHYVEIHSAEGQRDRARHKVEAVISDRSAPLIVVLRAYDPIEWSLKIEKGSDVRQIVLYGQYRQTYVVDRSDAPVRAYSPEEGNHEIVWGQHFAKAQNSRLDLRDTLHAMFGIVPATMQFNACPRNVCVVDGERSWKYEPVGKSSGDAVVWMVGTKPSPHGARVTHPGGLDVVRASEARNSGRWYFEVKADPLATGYSTWAGATIGVVDASRSGHWSDLLYQNSVTAGSARRLQPGSTVSVALDLEAGAVYYGIDGQWVVGDPAIGQGGKPLARGRDYFPALIFYSTENVARDRKVSGSDVDPGAWTGRFAARDFSYPVPKGFRPYQGVP